MRESTFAGVVAGVDVAAGGSDLTTALLEGLGNGVVQISQELRRGELRKVHVGQGIWLSLPLGSAGAEGDEMVSDDGE